LKIKLIRGNQSYIFPVLLSDEVLPTAIFYGTVCPLLAYFCAKTLIIDPHNKRSEEEEVKKSRRENASKLAERKKEAKSVINLMEATFERVVDQETAKKGLVILRALYGSPEAIEPLLDDTESVPETAEAFNVTIPLQCLVKDSVLSLPPGSKVNLPGFYDPCLGEEKQLSVRYRFRDLVHQVVVNDEESLEIPNNAHLGNSGSP
jgi:DnaJ family protein C protein 11